jgi:transcriptional regulator with XRE-family HTH domain
MKKLNKFGEKIKFLREKIGLYQSELATLLNTSSSVIHSWESRGCIPQSKILIQLSKIFNVSIDWLLGNEIEKTFEDLIEDFMSAGNKVTDMIVESDKSLDDFYKKNQKEINNFKQFCLDVGGFFEGYEAVTRKINEIKKN